MQEGIKLLEEHEESKSFPELSINVDVLPDVNYDNQINVQDLVFLVNIILDNVAPNNESDINQDNQINILDAILLVNLILEL